MADYGKGGYRLPTIPRHGSVIELTLPDGSRLQMRLPADLPVEALVAATEWAKRWESSEHREADSE